MGERMSADEHTTAGDDEATEAQLPDVVEAGGLSPEARAQIERIKQGVDVTDPQVVVQYGLPAQSRIAAFTDSLLEDIRGKDTGYAGKAIGELMVKVKDLDVDSLTAQGSTLSRVPLIGGFMDSFRRFVGRYQKLSTSIEQVVDSLESARMQLLKDITVLDKMYELNLEHLEQLDVFIEAGKEIAADLRERRLPAVQAEAAASGDPLALQRAADLEQAITRFERRVYDLQLSRMICIQTAPQLRLIQNNDQNLVEKIQTSIMTTVPIWKNQIVIAISVYRQQKALELQKTVTDTANELLAKNAEMLRQSSGEIARETERGVVDLETLKKVNAELVATLEETISIQEEGRQRRAAAEQELAGMERELREKLLALRAQPRAGELPPGG
jgi:uncharacterized protein YaaN involved in tellurite resistance